MSEHTDVLPVRQGHLPHDGKELPGAPPPDARTADEACENAEKLIRSLVIEQRREETARRLPPLARPNEAGGAPATGRAGHAAHRPTRAPDSAAPSSDAKQPRAPARRTRFAWLTLALPKPALPRLRLPAVIRGLRPKRWHGVVAVLALVMLAWPLLLPAVAFLSFWLGVIAYLTIGPDRCGEICAGLWARFEARAPKRAERLRRRADVFAERIDRVLDRLPEHWAERLALPDFSAPPPDTPVRPDPFDRLSAQARDV